VPTTHRNNKTSSITSFVCFNEEMWNFGHLDKKNDLQLTSVHGKSKKCHLHPWWNLLDTNLIHQTTRDGQKTDQPANSPTDWAFNGPYSKSKITTFEVHPLKSRCWHQCKSSIQLQEMQWNQFKINPCHF
jgi:hypothetical protein